MLTLALLCFACALLPLGMALDNLRQLRAPPPADGVPRPVSLLIPARNEAANIGAMLDSACASRGVALEIVVLDDHSSDGTADIVRERAARDPRIRLESATPLPAGWSGKMHACAQLGRLGRCEALVFVDADVRLEPDGLARVAAFLERSGAALVSGVPRQITRSWAERLVVPQILMLLLGFLPMRAMRRSPRPGYGAACGQLIAMRRQAYEAMGGHGAVRATLHDGLKLPRAVRAAGLMTDLFDATDIAACRMYAGLRQTWDGFGKNAREGMAGIALPVWTLLLGLGQVAPALLVLGGLLLGGATGMLWWMVALLAWGIAATLAGLLAWRFSLPRSGVLTQPLAILLVLAIQWNAAWAGWRGRAPRWRGRVYERELAPK